MFDKKKPRKVNALITGLDAAGKTTILYKLKLGEVVTTIPTIGFNVESVDYKEIQLTGWDLGGRGGSRHLYRHYLTNTQAVIYVVDANDQDRAKRSAYELAILLRQAPDLPVVVVANKQDLPNALSPKELREEMGLLKVLKGHPWTILGLSAVGDQTIDHEHSFETFRTKLMEWLSYQTKDLAKRMQEAERERNSVKTNDIVKKNGTVQKFNSFVGRIWNAIF